MSWGRVVLVAVVILFVGRAIVKWIAPGVITTGHVLTMIIALFTWKLVVETPESLARSAHARREGRSLFDQARAFVPPEILGVLRFEHAQHRGFLSWLLRRSPISEPVTSEHFEHHRKSQYSTVLIIVLLSCVVELPLSGLLVEALVEDPIRRQYIHWFVLAVIAYTIVWLIGDRYAVQSSKSKVKKDGLELRIGERFLADIPWSAVMGASRITQVKELSEARGKWLRRNGFDPEATVIGTPVDPPNVAILLDKTGAAHIEKFKIRRAGVQHLLIYIDESERFIGAVHKQLSGVR